MKPWILGALALCTTACASLPFGIGAPDTTPRWVTSATAPVMVNQWMDGFVPETEWNVDTLRVYGDGRWEAERTFSANLNKPPVMVATGSLSPSAMQTLLGTVFVKAEGDKRFVDLPERLDAGIADAPITRLSVEMTNASHSVSVAGTKPPAFVLVERELAKRTVTVPFPQ